MNHEWLQRFLPLPIGRMRQAWQEYRDHAPPEKQLQFDRKAWLKIIGGLCVLATCIGVTEIDQIVAREIDKIRGALDAQQGAVSAPALVDPIDFQGIVAATGTALASEAEVRATAAYIETQIALPSGTPEVDGLP